MKKAFLAGVALNVLLSGAAFADITIGVAGPMTGQNAAFGEQLRIGAEQAVADINKAGGVNGEQLKLSVGDDACDPKQAVAVANQFASQSVPFVAGHFCSGSSIPASQVYAEEGIVQISPANTSTAFDTYADGGLYFRTAPSDVLQGQVMASTAIEDGYQNIAIMARQEAYGEALAKNVRQFFEQAGGKVVSYKLYDPNAANYTAEVNAIAGEDPDAVVLIAFDETKKIIPEFVKAGIGQKKN